MLQSWNQRRQLLGYNASGIPCLLHLYSCCNLYFEHYKI
jgi:hypothetical protein